MDKRSGYLAGVIVGASVLVSQYVFDLDLGAFVWPIAAMTVIFAAALFVTPKDENPPSG
jgi:hypothetical protein